MRMPTAELHARRAEALDARRDALASLAIGEIDLQDLVVIARVDQRIGRLRIRRALEALPGVSARKTLLLMEQAGILERRRLRFLAGPMGRGQLKRLLDAIELDRSGPPVVVLDPRWPWESDDVAPEERQV